jgi:hypothetical protein
MKKKILYIMEKLHDHMTTPNFCKQAKRSVWLTKQLIAQGYFSVRASHWSLTTSCSLGLQQKRLLDWTPMTVWYLVEMIELIHFSGPFSTNYMQPCTSLILLMLERILDWILNAKLRLP